MLENNLCYFEYSLNHKELLLDSNYFVDEVIINDSTNVLVMNERELNRTILEYAAELKKCREQHIDMNEDELGRFINKIIDLLEYDGMNLTAFAQSFSIFDASFSLYYSLSRRDKEYFLGQILDSFVSSRLELYAEIGSGYLQILYDSHAHKRIGSAGAKKISSQLNNNHFAQIYNISLENNQYFLPDQVQVDNYLRFLSDNHIECRWTDSKQKKMPDAVFKYNDRIFIVEHKHLKEGGGGQDKQLGEIIDLIRYKDNNVSYISYMDGMYFNSLINPKPNVKISNSKNDILKYLEGNSENYFLNTHGFEKFLKDLKR